MTHQVNELIVGNYALMTGWLIDGWLELAPNWFENGGGKVQKRT